MQRGRKYSIVTTQPSSLVGTSKSPSGGKLAFVHRCPPEKRAEFAFNPEQGGVNHQQNPPERNGTLECSDARTGDRTETRERHDDRPELDEAVVRGGSKPHAAPLEHTDKSAGENPI